MIENVVNGNKTEEEIEEVEDDRLICDICGSKFEEWELTDVDFDLVCDDCLNEHYIYCAGHGEYEQIDLLDEGIEYINGDYYCHSYCVNHFYYCECCERWIRNSAHWDFDRNCCINCVPAPIKTYHENHGREVYFYNDGSYTVRPKYFAGLGVELEVENRSSDYDCEDMAQKLDELFNASVNHVTFECDGSLNDGFEIITNPHEEQAFYDLPWQDALYLLRKNGYSSHNAGTCGLHIHFSRTLFGENPEQQWENIAKIIAFYNIFWKDCLKASRRKTEHADHWACNYMLNRGELENQCKYLAKEDVGRYFAVNTTNRSTVEFRLGRGTLRYKTFLAWIDFNSALVRNSQNITWDKIDNLKIWLNGISDNTCEYFQQKNIFSSFFEEDV